MAYRDRLVSGPDVIPGHDARSANLVAGFKRFDWLPGDDCTCTDPCTTATDSSSR